MVMISAPLETFTKQEARMRTAEAVQKALGNWAVSLSASRARPAVMGRKRFSRAPALAW